MKNNRGQALVMFILFLPVIMLFLAFTTDTIYMNYEKYKLDNINYTVLTNLKSYPGIDVDTVVNLLTKNDDELINDKIELTSNKITIENHKRIPSLFGRIIGYNEYLITSKKEMEYKLPISKYDPILDNLYLHFTGIDALIEDKLIDRTMNNTIDYYKLEHDSKTKSYLLDGNVSNINSTIDFDTIKTNLTSELLFKTNEDIITERRLISQDFYDNQTLIGSLDIKINNNKLEIYKNNLKEEIDIIVIPNTKYYLTIEKTIDSVKIYLNNQEIYKYSNNLSVKSLITTIGKKKEDLNSFNGNIYTYRIYTKNLTDIEKKLNYENALKEYEN